jgi:AraC-like DNA-binding protein
VSFESRLPIDGRRPPPGLLHDALGQLRLQGAIFFRSELSEGFAFESTPLALADALRPGAERLTLFHIVAGGSCWVAVTGGERHWVREGDVIVLPYGDRYAMGGATPAETVPILDLLDPLPWAELPVIRHGGGGARTDIVCGYMMSDDPLFDPVVAPALSLIHGQPDRSWTVRDLAARTAVSRSLLDQEFRAVLGRSPIRYLTEWRMHLADDLLATTDTPVATVARRVGYDSAEAFSRAFKRARGRSPSQWRDDRRGPG